MVLGLGLGWHREVRLQCFYLLFPITNDEEITTELDAASLHVLED